jgi:NitT/TauT family transport system ATP-binding protein
VREIIENPLPRPRDYRSPELLRLVDRLHDVIVGHEMPDVPAPPHGAPAPGVPEPIEPLPNATPSEIVGLLEYLDARGGAEDVFRIASDTHRPFDQIIAIVKAAEMLGLVDTPKRRVVLEAEGRRLLAGDAEKRRAVWRDALLSLALFRDVRDLLARCGEGGLDSDTVLEKLAIWLPDEDWHATFALLVRWARYGELFGLDEEKGRLTHP